MIFLKKKLIIIPVCIVLAVVLVVGSALAYSHFNNSHKEQNTQPTTSPTTQATTAPTTEPSTAPTTTEPATEVTTTPDTNDPFLQQLDNMTLAEKAGQVVVCGLDGYSVDSTFTSLMEDYKVGGVILFSKNIESSSQLAELTNSIKNLGNPDIPPIIAIDEEGGQVSRMPYDIESMPSAYSIAQTGSTELCYNSGVIIGNQLNALGLSTGFSPVLDIWSNPDNLIISTRAYGTNADEVSTYATQVMQGLKSQEVIPVGKHFPGHGDTLDDSHYSLPVVTKTKAELENFEFVPFKTAIDNGIPAIMVGHLLCTEIDSNYPASLSKTMVTDILKTELGFDGVVFTDDLTMDAIDTQYSVEDASVMALNAGCDMLLVCHGYENAVNTINNIVSAVENGTLSEDRLNNAVYKILKLKTDYGITCTNVGTPNTTYLNDLVSNFNLSLQ